MPPTPLAILKIFQFWAYTCCISGGDGVTAYFGLSISMDALSMREKLHEPVGTCLAGFIANEYMEEE